MASEIEAEMARFEEEVLGSDSHNRNRNMPDLPPPPMFMQNNQSNNRFYEHGPGPGYDGAHPMHNRFNEDSLPPPGPLPDHHFDRMMGHGPMNNGQMPPGPMVDERMSSHGPIGPNHQGGMMSGPGNQYMSVGPGMSSAMISAPPDIVKPPVIAAKPTVYKAEPVILKPPQIVKRKADQTSDTSTKSFKLQPKADVSKSSSIAPPSYSAVQQLHDPGPPPMSLATQMIGPKKTTAPMSSSLPPSIRHKGSNPTHMAFSQASAASSYNQSGKPTVLGKKKRFLRTAAGTSWEDPTLMEWDPNDYRIFCGDLGNEVTDDMLMRVFNKYPSFQRAKVVREKNSKKTKGYGFVSFRDPNDFIRAMREMNGKYVGNRPIKLRKSNWKDRNADVVRKKLKEKKKLGYKI